MTPITGTQLCWCFCLRRLYNCAVSIPLKLMIGVEVKPCKSCMLCLSFGQVGHQQCPCRILVGMCQKGVMLHAASKRLLAFYDSAVDARSAPLADVSRIAMPAKTKPSLKFAQWLKGEGTNFMAGAQVSFSRLCEPRSIPPLYHSICCGWLHSRIDILHEGTCSDVLAVYLPMLPNRPGSPS